MAIPRRSSNRRHSVGDPDILSGLTPTCPPRYAIPIHRAHNALVSASPLHLPRPRHLYIIRIIAAFWSPTLPLSCHSSCIYSIWTHHLASSFTRFLQHILLGLKDRGTRIWLSLWISHCLTVFITSLFFPCLCPVFVHTLPPPYTCHLIPTEPPIPPIYCPVASLSITFIFSRYYTPSVFFSFIPSAFQNHSTPPACFPSRAAFAVSRIVHLCWALGRSVLPLSDVQSIASSFTQAHTQIACFHHCLHCLAFPLHLSTQSDHSPVSLSPSHPCTVIPAYSLILSVSPSRILSSCFPLVRPRRDL